MIQQRKSATNFQKKLGNYIISVNLNLFQFFLCWIQLSKWVFDLKKSETNLISSLLTKNWFQRTVLQDTDFIRFFIECKQRKISDSFSVQTWRLMFLKGFNNSDSFSLPIRNQQRSFIDIFSAKPFKIDRNPEQTFWQNWNFFAPLKLHLRLWNSTFSSRNWLQTLANEN